MNNLYLVSLEFGREAEKLNVPVIAKSLSEAIEKFEKVNHQHRIIREAKIVYVDVLL